MQMLPPTVAAFQILNDTSNAWQHSRQQRRRGPAGRRREPVELGDAAGRGDVEPRGDASSAGQFSASRSISVSIATCGSENSQVPPASQA